MWAGRVRAHDGPMFNSYETTRAFVAERQQTLRHEARQHHRIRDRRRGGRGGAGPVRPVRLPAPVDPAAATPPLPEDCLAA